MSPDTIGYVWTGEFDLNTLRVDGEIFESGKKKLWIQKYPDMCARGIRGHKQRKLNDHVYYFLCLCPLGLTIRLHFNMSKVAY